MRYPKVEISILNFNGLKDTIRCIQSVLKTNYPNFTITVLDNGSHRDEAKILLKKFPQKNISILRSPTNLGFTGGHNLILKSTKSDYIVLLNNDTQVSNNWLKPLVTTLEKNKRIAAAQPKILWLKNKKYFDYSGACGGFLDSFGYPYTKGRIFNTIEVDTQQYDKLDDIFWASGAAMMLRTKVLKRIGYFDERFFNYMEEIDLCFRIQKANYRIVCVPESYVFHKVASTSSKNLSQKRYWEHRNNLLLILKNFSAKHLMVILPIRIVLEYVSIMYYLFTFQPKYALSAFKAQIMFFLLSPNILWSRMVAKKSLNNSFSKKIKVKSIVFSYFILNKRRYTDLHV